MYDLNCNLFSISDDVIVSDIGFTRVNNILKNRGFIVEEINFSKISKLGGLQLPQERVTTASFSDDLFRLYISSALNDNHQEIISMYLSCCS